VLRIHFTPQDVGRVRVAAHPDPLLETVFSLIRLRHHGSSLVFGGWRHGAVRACRHADIETLMGRLANGDRGVMDRLSAAVRSQYEAAVAPIWRQVRAHVEADRSKRARAFLDGGSEGLLRSYLPTMRWKPPVLEVAEVDFEQTVHLDGRGLLFQPAFLSWATVDMLRDPTSPPVLVYPVEHDPLLSARSRAGAMPLASLIGLTRASVLEAVEQGGTTSELARRVGVSPASISQHTAVLREAGLIHTSRVGKAVLHTLTPLGAALLDADADAAMAA
jgi:DNA-binding transcriptional ArsR family regulator